MIIASESTTTILNQVVNDGDMYMWRELGISSWPTFAIIGPTGKLLAQLAGEGRRKVLISCDITCILVPLSSFLCLDQLVYFFRWSLSLFFSV